jgi:CBS domain-containing protein
MKVSECMTPAVTTIAAGQTIRDAARLMAEKDVGAIPVAENDRLIGMITDRDIAVRAVCEGKAPDTPVREVMTPELMYCYDDEDVNHVARNMGDIQVRRLPVMSRDKRLVGIIALGDIACGATSKRLVGEALSGISREGGEHAQGTHSH